MILDDRDTSTQSSINDIPRGTIMSQSTTAEIKTCSKNKAPSLYLPQLWFGRIAFLIRAKHTEGTFDKINIDSMQESLKNWEEKSGNQIALRKLTRLIHKLRAIVNSTEQKACMIISQHDIQPPILEVFNSEEDLKLLSAETFQRFWVGVGQKVGKA